MRRISQLDFSRAGQANPEAHKKIEKLTRKLDRLDGWALTQIPELDPGVHYQDSGKRMARQLLQSIEANPTPNDKCLKTSDKPEKLRIRFSHQGVSHRTQICPGG